MNFKDCTIAGCARDLIIKDIFQRITISKQV